MAQAKVFVGEPVALGGQVVHRDAKRAHTAPATWPASVFGGRSSSLVIGIASAMRLPSLKAIGEMSHRLVLVAAAIGGDNEPLLAAKIGDQEAEPLVEDPHLLAGRLVRLLGLA